MEEIDSPSTPHSHLLHPHQHLTVGSEVEVTINEEGFKGALFRATILKLRTSIFPSKKKNAVVEYKTLVTEDGSNPLKEQVDVLSLRPIPPDSPGAAFEECDFVDAVDKDGWWTGVVCKVLENGGYSVFFKNPMHVMDFQRNQLRLHHDWIDDNWVVPQKMGASILKEQLATIFTDGNIPEMNVPSGSLINAETNNETKISYSINSTKRRRRSLSCSKSSRGKSFSIRRIYQNFHSDSDLSDKFPSPKVAMEEIAKKNADGSDNRGHCTDTTDKDGSEDCDVVETTKEKGMEPPEQQQATENSSKRTRGRPRKFMEEPSQSSYKSRSRSKRGRPRKLMLGPSTATAEDEEQDGLGLKPDKETTKVDLPDLNKNLNELANNTDDIGTKSASRNIDNDDLTLSVWLGGIQEGQTSAGVNDALDKDHDWPFVKNSAIWSAIDALEVFKLLPQRPHFRPLRTYNEFSREGLAIGCMATFANLVDNISQLQFDNPREVFETMLASLTELQQHGFNISIPYNRVNELLGFKDAQMKYLEKSKEAEIKILEHTETKTKLAEEIRAMDQKIEEIQKRQSSFEIEIESENLEIMRLQSLVENIQECIEYTKQDFKKETTLPL